MWIWYFQADSYYTVYNEEDANSGQDGIEDETKLLDMDKTLDTEDAEQKSLESVKKEERESEHDAEEDANRSAGGKSLDGEESEKRSSVLSQMSLVAEESDQKVTADQIHSGSEGEKSQISEKVSNFAKQQAYRLMSELVVRNPFWTNLIKQTLSRLVSNAKNNRVKLKTFKC